MQPACVLSFLVLLLSYSLACLLACTVVSLLLLTLCRRRRVSRNRRWTPDISTRIISCCIPVQSIVVLVEPLAALSGRLKARSRVQRQSLYISGFFLFLVYPRRWKALRGKKDCGSTLRDENLLASRTLDCASPWTRWKALREQKTAVPPYATSSTGVRIEKKRVHGLEIKATRP